MPVFLSELEYNFHLPVLIQQKEVSFCSVQKCKDYSIRHLSTPESSFLLTSGLLNLCSVPTCLKPLAQDTAVVYFPVETKTWSGT